MVGLTFISQTTNYSPKGAIERFNGSQQSADDDLGIPDKYPKSITEMLMTTHNHVIGFSFIFLSIGIIFYFNSLVEGFWKKFLMFEPLFSIIVSFGSIWLMRFVDKNFVYLTILSAVLMYVSYFIMAGITVYELKFKG
jgi:hypothetical protein